MSMNSNEALQQLRTAGIKLRVENLRLRVSGQLTHELTTLLRTHKKALTGLVHAEQCYALEEVDMIEQKLSSCGEVRIYSKMLNEVVYWAVDDQIAKKLKEKTSIVVYTLAEIDELLTAPRITPDGLRRIHAAKKNMGGKIISEEVVPLLAQKK